MSNYRVTVAGHLRRLGLGRFGRAVVYLAAGLLALGVVLGPFLRVVAPSLAVECALRHGASVDPWGNAWIYDLKMGFAMACHSKGPDGVDGSGDDVQGVAGHFGFAVEPETFWWSVLGWVIAPGHVIGLGVVLGWFVLAPRLWSSDRQSLAVELVSAGVLAALPIGLSWAVVSFLDGAAGWARLEPAGPLLVSVEAGVVGTMSLVLYLLALWRRATRPPAQVPSPNGC